MRFFKDLKLMGIAEIKRYYRWKERIIWDSLWPIISFFGFILVWRAVLTGGFQGLGELTPENYITFVLSGSLMWSVISTNIGGRMIYAFVNEKYRRTLPYIMISPLNKISFLYGKLALSLIIILTSNFLILSVALLFFNFSFQGSLLLAVFVFGLSFLAFSGIGLAIASLGAWREGFTGFASVLMNVLYLFSGVHYPVQVFPESIRNIVYWLPTTQAINAIRAIGLNGAGLFEIMPQILYIGSLAVITPVLGYFTFRWVKNKAMILGI